MTYNQIIKFLKNTPRPNGGKYDLYRAFAEKTNQNISYLKAVIIDDGFRYEPDEDGYVTISLNEQKDGISLQKGITYYLKETVSLLRPRAEAHLRIRGPQ